MFSFLKDKLVLAATQDGSRIEKGEDALNVSIDRVVEELKENIYDQIRTIRDPEKDNNLEELNVVDENLITVYPFGCSGDKFVANIEFVPTVQHCSLAPLIGTCICCT
ncbi:MIP18 family protein FAM96A-like [Eurytemora carolleeae]|uniref:MIP18 family protein FAM96A-like n=1 Tax=Eurytemora carolleeae TaxID=1294199 RepID=UPI000C755BF6|nr:MIP18 family protein FAM96A-like [Eurytemora carolleeae]|eukprot:XP_023343510.1 MIP18 family protein FAM96A-like [Eurytemora affinis]